MAPSVISPQSYRRSRGRAAIPGRSYLEGSGAFTSAWSRYLANLWIAMRSFFWKPSPVLTRNQRLTLQRRLLESLARGAAYWIGLLLLGSVLVAWLGVHDANPRHGITIALWCAGLWALVLPYPLLLRLVIQLGDEATAPRIQALHAVWCLWIATVAFWWLSGRLRALIPQPPPLMGLPSLCLLKTHSSFSLC